jgi:hypothetical protein
LEHFLFAGYLLLFTWIVTKIKFFTRSGLNKPQLIIIFLIKMMAGILYGWIGIYYGTTAQMVDTWSFHYMGVYDYKLLHAHPAEYFTNLFSNPYGYSYTDFLTGRDSFWNELKAKFIVKLFSVFDIFSFGNYYINIIFYSFISMFGVIGCYRMMTDAFPGKNVQIAISVFFIPSFLYWTSGIHKDGLIFTSLIFIIYNFYFGFKEKKITATRVLFITAGVVLITLLRNFFLVLLIPPLLSWYFSLRFTKRPFFVFVLVHLFFAVIFFNAKYIHARLDFAKVVVSKQAEFLDMYAGSKVDVKELRPTATDFLKTIPQAFGLSVLRPYPSDVTNIFSLAAAVETELILGIFLLFLVYRVPIKANKPFVYFCAFFSVSFLLSVGYTVMFIGAIVRYRSLIFPFLLTPMIVMIDWPRIAGIIFKINGKRLNE